MSDEKQKTEGGDFRPRNSGQSEGQGGDASSGHPGQDERQYTLSISEEHRRQSFDIEDERWSTRQQIGDWLKLGFIVVVYLAVTYAVYLLEPGLK